MEQQTEDKSVVARRAFVEMRLSEGIRLSVKECEAIEAATEAQGDLSPAQRVYLKMNSWLQISNSGTCYACMAGAVMRGMLPQVENGEHYEPSCFARLQGYVEDPFSQDAQNGAVIRNRLWALNSIRTGLVELAFREWGCGVRFEYLDIRPELEEWISKVSIYFDARVNLEVDPADDHLPWEMYKELATILEKAEL